jgi:hypothetical protein
MPLWIMWMLVDSSGSMKPDARPRATTLRFQKALRRPVVNRIGLGSASGRPSRLASRVSAAASSDR